MKFRFVDKITSWLPYQRITGVKVVSFEEYSLKETFGDERDCRRPCSWKLSATGQLAPPAIVRFQRNRHGGADFRSALPWISSAGSTIANGCAPRAPPEDGYELKGEGRVNGRTIISGLGCLAVPVPAAELVDPADLRVLFSEIYEPGESVSA